jgi:Zn-dependent protease
MTEQPRPNLWLPPSPDAPVEDDFRAPPEPERSPEPPPATDPFGAEPRPWWKRVRGAIVAAVLVVVKFAAKLKALPMLVSVAAYSLIWGWWFALGFVVLLFVHEMGHVIALRREGIKASAPFFIPFMGAVVWSKSLGQNALAEARVGLAGPVLGSLGAAACIPLASATGSDYWTALAFTGFFLNLFNLLPVVPLDGGRAMAALSPWMWFAGLFGVLVLAFAFPNPIILLIALMAAFETWQRWRALKRGEDHVRSYYKVRPRDRALVAAVYLGLIVLLVIGMDATHLARTLSDV